MYSKDQLKLSNGRHKSQNYVLDQKEGGGFQRKEAQVVYLRMKMEPTNRMVRTEGESPREASVSLPTTPLSSAREPPGRVWVLEGLSLSPHVLVLGALIYSQTSVFQNLFPRLDLGSV